MTSYHVSILYDTSIGIRYPNNGGQFNKFGLQGCAKYSLFQLLQYLHGIQYFAVLLFCLFQVRSGYYILPELADHMVRPCAK